MLNDNVKVLRQVRITDDNDTYTLSLELVNNEFTRIAFNNSALPDKTFYVKDYNNYQFNMVANKNSAQQLSERAFDNIVAFYVGYTQSYVDFVSDEDIDVVATEIEV